MIDRPILLWILKGLTLYLEWRQRQIAAISTTPDQSRYCHGLVLAVDGVKAALTALEVRKAR